MKGVARPEIHSRLRSYPVKEHIVYYLIKKDHIVVVDVLHKRMESHKHIIVK